MCGIVGFSGRSQAAPILLKGLNKLEYRGYDSAGIAVLNESGIQTVKCAGRLANLERATQNGKKLIGSIGIGHTRWATHGEPNDINSHPHKSEDGKFAVVHNGIIENYAEIKDELIKRGFNFVSETDTEVVAQLLQYYYNGDVPSAICKIINRLEGSYALGIICEDTPDVLYAVRKDNPLVLGLGTDANYIASDIPALLEYTREFILLEDGEFAVITADNVTCYNRNIEELAKHHFTVDWTVATAEKGGYPHFMLKEIHEQPKVLGDMLASRIKGDNIRLDDINIDKIFSDNQIDRIDIVGCGSAYHAGIVGKYFIEKHCRIHVNTDIASEYRYRDPITDKHTLTIIISQSGETADTLAALRLAKSHGSHIMAIVNVVGSSIAREADSVLYMRAGPEIAVATTKGYLTQAATLILLGLAIGKSKGTIDPKYFHRIVKEFGDIPKKIKRMLENVEPYQYLAATYHTNDCAFFIGRGADYATSLEGALKLKEISYIHAEAYASGELKHGTISLIEEGTLTVAITSQHDIAAKSLSNIRAVKSRGGAVISICCEDLKDVEQESLYCVHLPCCLDDLAPLLVAVSLQLFAYYTAVARNCDVDKPRNLAKSVTVE